MELVDLACQAKGEPECEVIYLFGPLAFDYSSISRDVLYAAIEADHPEITVVAEQTQNFSPDEAIAAAQQLLPANPGTDVLALDCSFCAVALVDVLAEMGLGDSVYLLASASDSASIEQVKTGDQFGEVLLLPATEARIAIKSRSRPPAARTSATTSPSTSPRTAARRARSSSPRTTRRASPPSGRSRADPRTRRPGRQNLDHGRVAGLKVEVQHVAKRYGAAIALDDVSVAVEPGSIHGLVGENGAGKSTLGKIIAGAVAPDAGQSSSTVVLSLPLPRDAIRDGIAIIEQELALAPAMSVLDNVFLGVERPLGLVDRASSATCSPGPRPESAFLRPVGTSRTLRVADQQKVEIIRALVRDARLIVMDEPTAALPRDEAECLLELTRELRAAGTTIIYLSHILGDVLKLCDTVTVLKDGRHVRTAPAAGETADGLVTAMLGRQLDLVFPSRTPIATAAPGGALGARAVGAAEVRRCVVRHPARRDRRPRRARRQWPHRDRPRPVRRRSGIWDDPHEWSAGAIPLAEGPHPRGMALLPESRKDQGLVMARPVNENVSMAHMGAVATAGVLRRDASAASWAR